MLQLGGEGLRLVPQITVAAASPGAAVDALAAGLDVVADALAANKTLTPVDLSRECATMA